MPVRAGGQTQDLDVPMMADGNLDKDDKVEDLRRRRLNIEEVESAEKKGNMVDAIGPGPAGVQNADLLIFVAPLRLLCCTGVINASTSHTNSQLPLLRGAGRPIFGHFMMESSRAPSSTVDLMPGASWLCVVI